MTNLAQWREIQLPKITRDKLIPPRSTVISHGWYGPTTWAVEFLCDGVRCRVAVTLQVMDDIYKVEPEDVDVWEGEGGQ